MQTILIPLPLRLFSCSAPLRDISASLDSLIDNSDSLTFALSNCLIIDLRIGHVVVFNCLYVGPTIHLRSPGCISLVSNHIKLRIDFPHLLPATTTFCLAGWDNIFFLFSFISQLFKSHYFNWFCFMGYFLSLLSFTLTTITKVCNSRHRAIHGHT